MFGSPVFVGRVDTCFHLKCALERRERASLKKTSDLTLRKVKETEINSIVSLPDVPRVLEAFKDIISGKPDGLQITDVIVNIEGLLKETPKPCLDSKLLVTVSVGVMDHGTKSKFNAWAFIPAETKISELFVARESLNGTLVLATTTLGKSQILAYLTMTHQRYGTYLIKSSEEGIVDVVFKRAEKGGVFGDLNLGFGEDMNKLLKFGGLGLGLNGLLDQATDVAIVLDEDVTQVE